MLIDWINDVLVGERIIVKDLAEDLYDGQVLQKLFGKNTSRDERLNFTKTYFLTLNVSARVFFALQRSWRVRN